MIQRGKCSRQNIRPLPSFNTAELALEPLLVPEDFDISYVLKSFPKSTAAGPSGLRVQHLLDAAAITLPTSIYSLLRGVVNLLASGKAPREMSIFLAGGSLSALNKLKDGCPSDVRPLAVGEVLRHLTGRKSPAAGEERVLPPGRKSPAAGEEKKSECRPTRGKEREPPYQRERARAALPEGKSESRPTRGKEREPPYKRERARAALQEGKSESRPTRGKEREPPYKRERARAALQEEKSESRPTRGKEREPPYKREGARENARSSVY